jgi:hypothetical protein
MEWPGYAIVSGGYHIWILVRSTTKPNQNSVLVDIESDLGNILFRDKEDGYLRLALK